MNLLISLGKYLYAMPMIVFGVMHFMNADQMSAMAPGGKVMVFIAGVGLILTGISIVIGKMDKLAAVLLAIMLLLFIIPHVQMMIDESLSEMVRASQVGNILKNIALAGGALGYAAMAKDKSVIG